MDEPPLSEAAGTRLGPYRLLRELGRGGMGTVYLAEVVGRDAPGLPAGALVAIKTFHAHLTETPDFDARFRREAEIGTSIRHPNVARTFCSGAAPSPGGTTHYLVMEYVAGQTLRALLDELGRVPEELCRHIGAEVANALAAVHSAGAIHRDVKPENVLLTADSVVKLMDLGVARLVEERMRLSQSGMFVGSLEYAAPEQFGGAGLDARVDLHALGVTLYEMATGANPYRAEDLAGVVRNVLHVDPRRCGEIEPQISPLFEEVVHTLMRKRREDRIATAGDVARVLSEGESSAWWRARAESIRTSERRTLRRVHIHRETALHGRDAETSALRGRFDEASRGDGRVVIVTGEAGIGKSRLVDEFVSRLRAAGEEIHYLSGAFPPGGAAAAGSAFTEAFRDHFGARSAAGALSSAPALAAAFDALLRGEAAPEGAAPLTNDAVHTCFALALRHLAAERPTVLLADDLHLASGDGRALFASLSMAVARHRVLLVGTARPEIDERWVADVARLGATRIDLPRLAPGDVGSILREAVGSDRIADDVVRALATRSDGNPLFVLELLRALRADGLLAQRADGTWAAARGIDGLGVPSSLRDVVDARLAELAEDDRELLEAAACCGFEFDPSLVAAAVGAPLLPTLRRFARLERTQRLVRSIGRRCVFDHHLLAAALYDGLTVPVRELCHAAIADALVAHHGAASRAAADLDGSVAVEIVGHCLRGARAPDALRYLAAALTHLERSSLNDAAIDLADRALDVPGLLAGSERVEVILRKVARLDVAGRRDAQQAALDEARTLADRDGAPVLRSRVRRAFAGLLRQVARPDEAQSMLAEALALARGAGSRAEEAAVVGAQGTVLLSVGRRADALGPLERQREIAREIGDRALETTAAGNIGLALLGLGRTVEASACFERHRTLASEAGDRQGEAVATANLGTVDLLLGRVGAARERFRRRLVLARETGDRRGEASAAGNLGVLVQSVGRLAEAREHLDAALALSREIGARWNEALWLSALAGLDEEEGDAGAAERRHGASIDVARGIGQRELEAEFLLARGGFLDRCGRADEAVSDLESAARCADELALPSVGMLAAARLASIRPHARAAAAETARAALVAHGASVGPAAAMETRFLLWRATGDPADLVEARRLLDQAVAAAPPEDRETMLANVATHRDIAAAARAAGI